MYGDHGVEGVMEGELEENGRVGVVVGYGVG